MIVPVLGFDLGIKSVNVCAQERLNLYLDVKTERDKSSVIAYGTPGTNLFNGLNAGALPYRGLTSQIGNFFYGVKSGTFYSVNNAGVETSIGTLNTIAGNVALAYNGTQVMLVDGTNGYIYSTVAGPGTAQSISTIVDNFPVATVTTGSAHGLTTGNLVLVAGASPAGYNGLHAVKVTSPTVFTYELNADPGGNASPVGTYTQPAFGQITDSNFPNGATTVDQQGGNFIVDNNAAALGQYNISNSFDGTCWQNLNNAAISSFATSLIRPFINQGILHLLGDSGSEFWSNTGNVNFPYALIQGSAIEWGLAAKWSVAKLAGAATFVAKNLQGHVQIVQLQGFQPAPISSPELEAALDTYTISDAVAFSYMLGGHQYYQVTFPSSGKTWLYDYTMSQVSGVPIWSQLSSGGGRHIAQFYVNYLNQNIVSDYASGNLYTMSSTTYTDNGMMIQRQLRMKHIFKNNQQVSIGRLWVDFETGVGVATGQGSNPQVMMRYSKDGGHSYSAELWRSLGAIGKYLTRAIWHRLGRARVWVFEVTVSDPVKVVIANAGILLVEGRE